MIIRQRTTKHIFDTEDEFVSALKRVGFGERDIEYIANHERDHFNVAQELGYKPQYEIKIFRVYFFGYLIKAKKIAQTECRIEPTKKDAIEIALAPRNPSLHDYEIAESAGGRVAARLKYMGLRG